MPPLGAAAGVVDGVAEEVVPPRLGNKDFCGVADNVAGVVEGCALVVVVPREKAGLGAESVPEAGFWKREGA
jgi:hypothetical protein